MKVLCILAVIAVAVSAVPLPEEKERVSGVNGWYVPQIDGSFKWITIDEGEKLLAEIEKKENEAPVGRLTSIPVTFYLYTNKNPSKAEIISESMKTIEKSDFDASNPTKFVIHGWTQSHLSGLNKEIRSAWLSRGQYNVIIVDWARAREVNYADSVSVVPKVGKKIASFIDYLVENVGVNLDDVQVIGHSLGAHVAGFIGKNVKNGKVQSIVGLDTALPLYSYKKPNKRLSADDAQYVESIHTNGGYLGFLEPIGKGAFYPNGGKNQPGCGLDVTGMCDHHRSCSYYAEAVARDSFPSMRCADYKDAVKNKCGASYSNTKMGSETNAYVVDGQYYVPVNNAAPFGFGV